MSFYFSGVEVSLFCLRQLSKKTKNLESYLSKYEQSFEHYLTLCLFGNVLSGIVVSHITFLLCFRWFGAESSGTWIEMIFCTITVGILFYAGEVIPKILVRRSVVGFLRSTQFLLKIFSIGFYPVILIIEIFNKIFFTKLGVLQDQKRYILSREDLRHCFQEGLEFSGKQDSQYARFFPLAITLSNIKASEIMIPLVDLQAFDEDLAIEKVIHSMRSKGEKRGMDYVVLYKNRVDAISGYVLLMDLLQKEVKIGSTEKIKTLTRKPVFLPKTNTLESVLQQFWKQKKEEIVILVDEYGGCCGTVDRSSIIRKIFGVPYKETVGAVQENGLCGNGGDMIKRLGPLLYEVDTLFYIDDLNACLGISLPKQEGYETLAGLINARCERILPRGSTFEIDGVRCTVILASPTSVDRVLLELLRDNVV